MRSRPTCVRASWPEMPDNDHITWRAMLARVTESVGDDMVAKWLCEEASGCNLAEFHEAMDDLVTQRSGLHLEAMLRRYFAGEPLQYVLGHWSFRHLDLMVDARVLIPRPETEQLVEVVLQHLHLHGLSQSLVADLGTGSGAIGLSILHEMPLDSAVVWMTDASHDSLDVARANAAGIGRKANNARFVEGSWFAALPDDLRHRFDVIVTNPPYIADNDPEVESIVREWEPRSALFAGDDGLDHISRIVADAGQWLADDAMLAMEIGHRQGDDVLDLMLQHGYARVEILDDLAGKPRIARGYWVMD